MEIYVPITQTAIVSKRTNESSIKLKSVIQCKFIQNVSDKKRMLTRLYKLRTTIDAK